MNKGGTPGTDRHNFLKNIGIKFYIRQKFVLSGIELHAVTERYSETFKNPSGVSRSVTPNTTGGFIVFMTDYSKLLQNPKWQKKRLLIFNRDNWTCRRCGDKETMLQVHHLWYNLTYMPWDYPNDALITVCDLCHKKVEFFKWFASKGLFTLIGNGFTRPDANDIRELVFRRIEENTHRESVIRYMDNIKLLVHG